MFLMHFSQDMMGEGGVLFIFLNNFQKLEKKSDTISFLPIQGCGQMCGHPIPTPLSWCNHDGPRA